MKLNYLTEMMGALDKRALDGLIRFAKGNPMVELEYQSHAAVLIEKLTAFWPEFDKNNLDPDELYRAVFPEGKVAQSGFDKTISDANTIVRTYSGFRQYMRKENAFQQILDIAIDLRQKGLFKRYEQTMEKLKKQLDQKLPYHGDTLWHRYLYENEVQEYASILNRAKDDQNLPNVIEALTSHYRFNYLHLLNQLASQNLVANCISPEKVQQFFDIANQNIELSDEGSSFYIPSLINRQLQDTSSFDLVTGERLINLLAEREDVFGEEDLYYFYRYLLNIITTAYNRSGKSEFLHLKHRLQIKLIEKKFIFYENQIHVTTYLSITRNAILVGELDWADQFIETYKDQLAGEDDLESVYKTTKGMLLFYAKRYEDALDILPQSGSYSYFNLYERRIELMALYELNSDLVPYKLDAYKMYISRSGKKKLAEDVVKGNTNFINMVFMLNNTLKGDKNKVKMLRRKFDEHTVLAERQWIKEKIDEMEK